MTPTARPAAHAGTFYPAERIHLQRLVDGLLADAAGRLPVSAADGLRGVLVPHAGLDYSGPIAALGWTAVARADPDVVILVGTDHWGRARGVAMATSGPWLSPAGATAVDEALAVRLAELGAPFHPDDAAHRDEHSLEVQLPFLAKGCRGVPVVPMLVGGLDAAGLRAAAETLAGVLRPLWAAGRRPILVMSSDLAHYPAAELAEEIDRRMLGPVMALDAAGLRAEEGAVEASGLPGVACGMCGEEPVELGVVTLGALGARRATLLGHATSADVPRGDRHRTVGYAAVAFNAGR